MRESDVDEFGQMLDAVCSLLSRGTYTPNPVNTALFFRALARHDIAAVRAGFDAHVADPQRGRFVPTPADILAQIEGLAADDGRPGAEEAWATAIRSADEADTIVWTDETARAWGVARVVLNAGDEVGARMAFKEVYARFVDEARRARKPVQWSASLGFDTERRHAAIEQASAAGLLPKPDMPALPAPRPFDALTANPQMPQEVRQKLSALRERLSARTDEPSHAARAIARTRQLQADTQAAVEAYQQ